MGETTTGELKIMLGGLSEKFDGFRKRNEIDHAALIAQTTRTNGRVTSLERFQNMALGGIAVLSAMVVPLFVSFMKDYMSK